MDSVTQYESTEYLLIDADILIYQAAAKHSGNTAGRKENVCEGFDDLGAATEMLVEKIEAIFDRFKTRKGEKFYISGAGNWRKEVNPTYKANRKDTVKPTLIPPLRDYVKANYPVCQMENLEADDCIASDATQMNRQQQYCPVIVSIDKDFLTVPDCYMYNWNKPELGVVFTTAKTAFYNLMIQVIMGDRADGYEGIKGIGIKKAEKYLKPFVGGSTSSSYPYALYMAVKGLYTEKGYTLRDMQMTVGMAHLGVPEQDDKGNYVIYPFRGDRDECIILEKNKRRK